MTEVEPAIIGTVMVREWVFRARHPIPGSRESAVVIEQVRADGPVAIGGVHLRDLPHGTAWFYPWWLQGEMGWAISRDVQAAIIRVYRAAGIGAPAEGRPQTAESSRASPPT